jgi:hypothetical protein
VALLAWDFLGWPHKARYTAGICFVLGPWRADISGSGQAGLPRATLAPSWTSSGNVTEATEGLEDRRGKKFLDCETFPEILNHTARSSVRLVIEPTSSARRTNFDLGRWSRCSFLPSLGFKLSLKTCCRH